MVTFYPAAQNRELHSNFNPNFHPMQDFEVQEEESVEEGLEAIPSLRFHDKIDEEEFMDGLSLDEEDDFDRFEDVRRDASDARHDDVIGSDVVLLKEEDQGKPKLVRIPLIAEKRPCSSAKPPVIPPAQKSSQSVVGGDIPRFFQTTVTPPRNGEKDAFPSSKKPSSPRDPASPVTTTTTNRPRRVPTLPSLPPPTPKEKNSIFSDFFGGKTKSENESSEANGAGSGGGGSDALDKMKNKISSAFNNVKYGWTIKTKTDFRSDTAIWLLGELYHPAHDLTASADGTDRNSNSNDDKSSSTKILDMFKSVRDAKVKCI